MPRKSHINSKNSVEQQERMLLAIFALKINGISNIREAAQCAKLYSPRPATRKDISG